MSEEVTVIPEYLEDLAKQQDRAVAEISSATAGPKDTFKKIWYDHGVLCGSTAQALRGLVQDRARTGATMTAISEALAANLRQAAADYRATDASTAEALDTQMLYG
jgi:hypothetical protein